MKKINDWLKTWSPPQAIVACAALVCATALAIAITLHDDWGRLFRWLSDPATSGLLISIAALFGVLYHRALGLPPAILLFAVLGASSLTGCGASALQTAALGTTVALRATHAIDQAYETDLERRLSECPGATSSDAVEIVDAHNACGDAIRAGERDIATVLDALPVAIEAFGAGVAVQAELDAGAAIPVVVLDTVRTVLSLFDQVEVLLRARGVVIPPAVDMVVRALSALLPPPSGAA